MLVTNKFDTDSAGMFQLALTRSGQAIILGDKSIREFPLENSRRFLDRLTSNNHVHPKENTSRCYTDATQTTKSQRREMKTLFDNSEFLGLIYRRILNG